MPANDFNVMQTQAIRFAREMQQKARQNNEPPKPPPPPKQNLQNDTPFCKNACPIKNILGIGNSGGDSDMLLLMALLLVLSSDGGDRMLMLALLYIMT